MTVVVAGHFPPPVHGMAVAVSSFADLVERTRPVVRLDLSPGTSPSRARHHAHRLLRVVRAWVQLPLLRRRGATALFLGCDAGLGMLYTTVLLLTGRALGYQCFVHHHSFAYVTEHDRLMALLVAAGGPGCCHLTLCDGMRRAFAEQYPRARRVELLPCAFAVEASTPPAHRSDGGPLVLGHLSNLRVEKGLDAVFETAAEIARRGVDARLVLAGPPASPRDADVLAQRLEGAEHAAWLGPVDADRKRAFFSELDLFLLPSTYSHEAAPLVALEALAHGVPVVAYDRGCLASLVLDEDFVIDPDRDFAEAAADLVQHQLVVPAAGDGLAERSRARFAMLLAESEDAAERVVAAFGGEEVGA